MARLGIVVTILLGFVLAGVWADARTRATPFR